VNNLIRFAPDRSLEIEAILYSNSLQAKARIEALSVRAEQSRFQFHGHDTLHHVANLAYGQMNPRSSVIVATDYVELIMVQVKRLDQKVIFIVLGDFEHYYSLATLHEGVIDTYVAISAEIYERLCALLPARKGDILQLYFPTPPVTEVHQFDDATLKMIYVARFDSGKNPLLLPRIDDILVSRGVHVQWTVVGDGALRGELEQMISGKTNFTFTGFLSNEALHHLYVQHDVFVMTSFNEGLPVSLIESMKTGLLPIVSDIKGGIREIVKHGKCGYLCDPADANAYAEKIEVLHSNRLLLKDMAIQAIAESESKFSSIDSARKYWDVIQEIGVEKRKKTFNFNGSFLDQSFLPNWLVRIIRSIK